MQREQAGREPSHLILLLTHVLQPVLLGPTMFVVTGLFFHTLDVRFLALPFKVGAEPWRLEALHHHIPAWDI